MLHALLLGAALLAAAPLDTRHAALLDALSSDHGGMSCSPAELRGAAADATIQSVGRVDGDDVVVAHLNGGCLCGAHNCPVYTLRLTAAKPRILMTTFGYGVSMRADSPLPRIVVRSNVNSAISNEETFAYRGGRYVDIENARVRSDTGARKGDIPVRFAASPAQPVPDATVMRWAQSLPEVHCVPIAFRAWARLRTDKDTSGVPTTLISGQVFARSMLSESAKATTTRVAGVERGDSDRYYLSRVPSAGAAVLDFIGTGDEDVFSAVIASATAPPRAVATLPRAPRTLNGIGLGSTRSAVEAAFGHGRSKAACGFDVVHYSQSEPRGSVAELWLFYRGGAVTAITYASGA